MVNETSVKTIHRVYKILWAVPVSRLFISGFIFTWGSARIFIWGEDAKGYVGSQARSSKSLSAGSQGFRVFDALSCYLSLI